MKYQPNILKWNVTEDMEVSTGKLSDQSMYFTCSVLVTSLMHKFVVSFLEIVWFKCLFPYFFPLLHLFIPGQNTVENLSILLFCIHINDNRERNTGKNWEVYILRFTN